MFQSEIFEDEISTNFVGVSCCAYNLQHLSKSMYQLYNNSSEILSTNILILFRSSKLSYKTRNHSRNPKRRKPTIPISFTKKQFCLFAKKKLTKEAAEILVKKYVVCVSTIVCCTLLLSKALQISML